MNKTRIIVFLLLVTFCRYSFSEENTENTSQFKASTFDPSRLLFFEEPKPAATFYIVRHGQTDWNVEQRIQGCSDIPMNETGKREAAKLADVLKSISFSACFSSDLQRAYETALILTVSHPLPVTITVDPRLRERDCGPWEGALTSDFYAAGPQAFQDIESNASLQSRALHFLKQAADGCGGGQILVVTHGGVMRNLILHFLALECPEESIITKNTAVLKLEYANGQWSVKEMQDIEFR